MLRFTRGINIKNVCLELLGELQIVLFLLGFQFPVYLIPRRSLALSHSCELCSCCLEILQHTPPVLNLLPFQCCTLMKLACLMGLDILGRVLKLACCYLGAANAAAEVVQVVLSQTSILQPLAARGLIPVQWHALLCVLGRPILLL